MNGQPTIKVTSENWTDAVDHINWRQPEVVDRAGNRVLYDLDGQIVYCIPFDVWYETKAYNRLWRKYEHPPLAGQSVDRDFRPY